MACGTNSGCDAALWPRGSARVARSGGAQGAAKWQGGHAATWAPLWGATCRFANKGEKRQLIGESIPLFIRAIWFYFLRVGLSHTVFSFAGDVETQGASDFIKTA